MPYKAFLPVCFFLIFFNSKNCFAQQPKLMLPIGHTKSVFNAHFSPDGKKVVTASEDKTVKIWDAGTGHLLADLKGHTDPLSLAQFSPDGKKIVSYSYDFNNSTNTVKIWNAVTGEFIADLAGQSRIISSVEFSMDSKKVLTISDSVAVWDAGTGIFKYFLEQKTGFDKTAVYGPGGEWLGFADDIIHLLFSPDGKWIVATTRNKTIILWDAATGKWKYTFKGYTDIVRAVYFTPDGNKIVTASANETVIWNANTRGLLKKVAGKIQGPDLFFFTPDGQKIITADYNPKNKNASVWYTDTRKLMQRKTGKSLRYELNHPAIPPGGESGLSGSIVAASNEKLAAVRESQFFLSNDKTALLWNISNGQLIDSLKGHGSAINYIEFSQDQKKLLTASKDGTTKIWDAASGRLLADLRGHTFNSRFATFSPPTVEDPAGGKWMVTTTDDGALNIWDPVTMTLQHVFKGPSEKIFSVQYSGDGKKLVTASYEGNMTVWDAASGRPARFENISAVEFDPTSQDDPEQRTDLISPELSPDGSQVLTGIQGKSALLFATVNKKLLKDLHPDDSHYKAVRYMHFSPDGTKIIAGFAGGEGLRDVESIIVDVPTLKTLFSIGSGDAQFSPDSKKVFGSISTGGDNLVHVWEAETGSEPIKLSDGPSGERAQFFEDFSLKGNMIFAYDWRDNRAGFWDAANGRFLYKLKGDSIDMKFGKFSPDGKKVLTFTNAGNAKVWDAISGELLYTLTGHSDAINYVGFSPDSKRILTTSRDNTLKMWDAATGKFLYTFFSVDSADYLVVDKDNHYDGTEAARKLLYYSQGTEIISLEQVKVDLWVPGLVERLNNGETIKEKSLEQLDVFGDVIPEIEATGSSDSEYRFSITPGKGGIGEIILYVNDIEVRRYKKEELKNNNGLLELTAKKEALKRYFVADEDNWVSAKVKTGDNKTSSQEARISIDKEPGSESKIFPNLYAVMIGTSRYKDDAKKTESFFDTDMNLSYPAIDARAISQTVERAAKKMLETDGKKHVFMYNLTTDSADSLKPDKQTIRRVLDSIGKKAAADDILMIYLSGHGVLYESDEKKQFYYLTADASSLTDEKAFPVVGISTDTLMEWIKLENIPANKRILVLDACYSGQVINDLKKDIDRLKENSKLFILSASASNKLSFESNEYEHGYLSYALLKVIKKQPDILLGTKLNISRWFNAAAAEVKDIARKENSDQTPHIITVVDFNIGTVDSSVIQNIRLVKESSLFVASNFQNADKIGDDLGFGMLVNEALRQINTGPGSKIEYADVSAFTDAYTVIGRYTVRGNEVEVKFIITKGKETIKEFDSPVRGTKDKLKELAADIAEKAAEWVNDNK